MQPRPNKSPDPCQTPDEFDEELELALIESQLGRLVDQYGHEHSEAIFKNWSPKAIRALGIHRIDDGGGADE
jgi:hypothetical protein